MKQYYMPLENGFRMDVESIEKAIKVMCNHIMFKNWMKVGLYCTDTHKCIGILKKEVTFTPIE